MLSHQGFDLWADGYDRSVHVSDEENSYPFAGYKKVLNLVYNLVRQHENHDVLDIGFGTGTLTAKLYQNGCRITGIDFSRRMIEIAGEKMPDALLIQHDFSLGYPVELDDRSFDAVICTYALHHLTLSQKIDLLRQLRQHVTPGGKILIGDVAFETNRELDACREANLTDWDSDEFYPTAEDLRAFFPDIRFQKISHCAGVFLLENNAQ